MKRLYVVLFVFVTAAISCRQRYEPKVKSLQESFLVVEANLNPGPDSAVIRLTRTAKLSETGNFKAEPAAQVVVEGNDNTTRGMTDIGNGKYYSPNLNLIPGTDYRIRIRTTDGKEYLSDYVRARVTPAIDSVSTELSDDGLRIYVNTHDPANATTYYRWDYDETWQIRSYYFASVKVENGMIVPRIFPADDVSNCWKYDTSSTILLASSARLQQDIIYKEPLTLIPHTDEKLSVRYSIRVRQYALDRNAYNFYELMKKNTEEIGSLFNPEPSEMSGNIHCLSDPSEYVLGYLTASTIEEQRIFIMIPWDFRQYCENKEIGLSDQASIATYILSGSYQPYAIDPFLGKIYASFPECVDCRIRGGSTTKPSFW